MTDIQVISLHHDPNFPENLRIHPSDRKLHASQHLDPTDFNETNFGFEAQELAIRRYGIAGRVWEAAYMMILYVQPPPHLEFDPPIIVASKRSEKVSMLELGSGTGFVASYLSRLLVPGRDSLIVTDLPEVCPLLTENLSMTKIGAESGSLDPTGVYIRPLSWGVEADAAALASEFIEERKSDVFPLTHIVCSDLVYFPQLLGPLLRSLLRLTSPPFSRFIVDESGPQVILSYKVRSLEKENAFWSAFGLWFEFTPVLVKDSGIADADWQRFGNNFEDTTFLFTARRRHESLHWTVPELDSDLLAGVGANGNENRKGDDTFENILLLSMDQ
ncbi:hypothetical protein CPC08DRAFT_706179 [Agrocybe pediades]|nr:hypothetical protein CPC08DRAFT_706179 [Agrocybe pediades]